MIVKITLPSCMALHMHHFYIKKAILKDAYNLSTADLFYDF